MAEEQERPWLCKLCPPIMKTPPHCQHHSSPNPNHSPRLWLSISQNQHSPCLSLDPMKHWECHFPFQCPQSLMAQTQIGTLGFFTSFITGFGEVVLSSRTFQTECVLSVQPEMKSLFLSDLDEGTWWEEKCKDKPLIYKVCSSLTQSSSSSSKVINIH